jgi:hypothetical protein
VSTVDRVVRTPGPSSAALPDTGHCGSRPDGHGRTRPPLLSAQAACPAAAPHEVPCPRWRPHRLRVRAGGWHPVVGRTLRLGRRPPQHEPGRRYQPGHACRTPAVRTPSVRTAVVPEAADGQSAARSDLLQLPSPLPQGRLSWGQAALPARPGHPRRARAAPAAHGRAGRPVLPGMRGGGSTGNRARPGPVPAAVSASATGPGRGSPRQGSPQARCWAAPPHRRCAR